MGSSVILLRPLTKGAQSANVKCELDLDALRAEILLDYTNESATVYQTVTGVLPGWLDC